MIEAPPIPAPPAAQRTSPYQGLEPFSERDTEFFFGRDSERQVIASNLIASRLTVVYGPSGVGKSSLLRAGVAYDLGLASRFSMQGGRPPDYVVAVFPGLSGHGPAGWQDDPIRGILDAVEDAIRRLFGDGAPGLSRSPDLAETLRAWSESLDTEFLLILDQFEEYFQYHGDEGGEGTFDVEFPRALQRGDLRANVLISIREDALAKLDRFKGRIRNLFGNYLRIRRLSTEAARASIEKPLEQYNLTFGEDVAIEPPLVDEVLRQVSAGRVVAWAPGAGATPVPADDDTGGVETPYLQLVMSRLWREDVAAGSTTLRLETLRRLGGADRIVRDHLDEALGSLSSTDRAVAAAAFRFLVTPSGAKIAYSLSDLAEFTDTPERELAPVLELLSEGRTRILSSVGPAPGGQQVQRYEIFHDVLGPAIRGWRARYESEVRLEREKQESRERAKRSRRRIRRLTVVAFVAVGFAVAVGVLAVWALGQKREAEAQRDAADSQLLVAQALAGLDSDPQESVRLALRAWDTSQSDQALTVLREAMSESRVRAIMSGHEDIVWTASYSPDGTKVVTASRDGTARIWDARTGTTLVVLSGHADQVNEAVFSPDGKLVVTASNDGTARVWDADTGEELHVLSHEAAVYLSATDAFAPDGAYVATGAFNADGTRLVTYELNGAARVWDMETGAQLPLLERAKHVRSAAFSPDGGWLVTSDESSIMKIWSVATGRLVDTWDNETNWSNSAVFSPDGRWVAVANSDTTIGVWNTRDTTRNGHWWLPFFGGKGPVGPGHTGPIVGVSFSPDSEYLLSVGDKTARVWTVRSGAQVAILSGESYVNQAEFSPDGNLVVTANQDGTARVFEWRTGRQLAVLRGHADIVWSARFSPDGKAVVTTSEDGTARSWSIDTGVVLRGHARSVLSAAFDSADARVVTSGVDDARIWDSRTGEQQGRSMGDDPPYFGWIPIWSADWSSDGRVVTAEDSGLVRIWDVDSERASTSTDCCLNDYWPAESAEFSPAGDKALVTYGDFPGTARMWEVGADGRWSELHVFDEGNVGVATLSPDGRWILTSGRDDKLTRIWSAEDFEQVGLIETGLVVDAQFSEDGSRIVSAGTDRTVSIWDVATGKLIRSLFTPTSVSAVAFSPDGRWVVAGESDGTTRVWDAETWQVLAIMRMHADSVNAVDVSADGRIVTASEDRTAKIYECDTCVSTDELIEQAREHAAIGTT